MTTDHLIPDDDRDLFAFGQCPSTLAEFVEGADNHYRFISRVSQAKYRVGQAYSNYGQVHFPESYRRIIATNTDPFYNDANLGRFLVYIVEEGWVTE